MSNCKFCGKNRPLVKSHVIPRSFFELQEFHTKAPKKALSIVSDSDQFKPMRRPEGIYDVTLFCHNCETKFMKYDDYAFKLLIENRHLRKTHTERTEIVGQYYDAYDYGPLKLFFMSVLLRAGLSGDFFFQHVILGPYVKDLKQAVDSGDPKEPDEFAVFLAYYPQIKSGPVIFPPALKKMDGVNFYYFHLGRVIFYIKVDKRKTPLELNPVVLKPGTKLFLLAFDLRDSNAYGILSKAVRNPSNVKYFNT